MVDSAGGRSQFAHLSAFVIVLVVLLFLTGPLAYMPNSVLAAIVFLVGVELVDVKGMRTILAQRPAEFWVALMTAIVVVFIGVEQGIILAILLSILIHTRHGYKPKNVVLTEQAGHLYPVPVTSPTQTLPGLLVYRFNHSMYYANAERLSEEVLNLSKIEGEPVTCLCIDMVAVDDVDFSAAATLRELYKELQAQSIRLAFVETSDEVRRQLDLSGITALVGPDAYYPRLHNVLDAYQQKAGPS
jgi:MFS superfamily sulfate permease-like transporter